MELQRVSTDGGESPGLVAARLPAQLVDRVAQRLCWITIFVAVTAVLLTLGNYLLQDEFAQAMRLPSARIALLGLLVLSGAFIVVQVDGWVTKERLLDLGMLYQVTVSFAISMGETSMNWDPSVPVRGHSGLNVWLLLC